MLLTGEITKEDKLYLGDNFLFLGLLGKKFTTNRIYTLRHPGTPNSCFLLTPAQK